MSNSACVARSTPYWNCVLSAGIAPSIVEPNAPKSATPCGLISSPFA